MIRAMLAHDHRGGIALNGTLPWPTVVRDWQWFEQHTRQSLTIMGSRTWRDSHMPRPWPGRISVVVTGTPELYTDADRTITDLAPSTLAALAREYPQHKIWITGGQRVFDQALPLIEECWLSEIPGEWTSDTHIDLDRIHREFELVNAQHHPDVVFRVWRRR